MNRTVFVAALLTGLSWTSAAAQTGIRAPQGFSIGVLGGAAAYSDMQRGVVRVTRPTTGGFEERELARRVGAKTSTSLAAYVAYWPSRNWGLRVHGTWSPTRFQTLMKESEAEFAGMAPSSDDEARLAGLSVMTGDLQVLFRLPTIKNRIMPYGILGGGIAAYQVQGPDPVPAEADGEFEGGTKLRPAGIFGVGAMLPLSNRAFRLHFELTDHLTGTPIRGGEAVQAETPDATFEFDPQDPPAGETRVRVTNSVRFMVGLSFTPTF
jgi:hypothetical protein